MGAERLGEYLKRERELRGISLEEVSEGTKISKRLLVYMESGRWEELPGEVFAKGFLKSYAEFIGIAPEEILLRFEEEKSFEDSEGEPGPDSEEKKRHIKGILIAVLILVALAILGYISYSAFWQKEPLPGQSKIETQTQPLASTNNSTEVSEDHPQDGESHKE